MIKVIALLRKRPDLTQEQFIAYYETRHAPLILSLLPGIVDYHRNYVNRDRAFASDIAGIDFDCVTEMRFENQASYDQFLARATEPDVASAIAQDEENVFDRTGTRMFAVHETPSAGVARAAVSELAAERAVREGLAHFARMVDGKGWAGVGNVFAADLTYNYGLGEQAGIKALTADMRRFLDRCGPSQHLIGSITVTVEPGALAATSRAYVQARHQRTNDVNGPVSDSNGEYIDRWECRREGWRIVRRDALWQTHSGEAAIIWGDAEF